jgi:hypothetical protein
VHQEQLDQRELKGYKDSQDRLVQSEQQAQQAQRVQLGQLELRAQLDQQGPQVQLVLPERQIYSGHPRR